VSVWKIAENVVGISVPLAMILVMEKVGKGTPDSARGGSPESEAKLGALPPLRSPVLNLGHHASLRMSGYWLRCLVYRRFAPP